METERERPAGRPGSAESLPAPRAEADLSEPAFPHCLAARTVDEACNGLADDLLAQGYDLPSVYLLVGGRLRCRAARGYFQVVDGFFPVGGVIGRTVTLGRPVVVPDVTLDPGFIAAVPGLRAEICVPVLDGDPALGGGTVLGAVNVESRSSLPPGAEADLVAAAAVLSERIRALGGLPRPSLGQRLAHIAVELTTATSEVDIEHRACSAAAELSGMDSAMLARRGPTGLRVTAGCGPLRGALRGWSREDLDIVAAWVSAGTSSHFPGGDDVPAGYEFLRASGVRAVSVHPLVVAGEMNGILVVAGTTPTSHSPEVVETLELLAAQTAASLAVAGAMQELARRATEDPLTGLGNAAAFTDALQRHLSPAGREPGTALLLIDVDHFKAVNDTYGHLAGDRLLQALAAELSGVMRDADRIYRVGGDEFAALIRVEGTAGAVAAAGRVVEAARRVRTTVSVGSVLVGADAEQARKAADVAMYDAKAAGRDTTRHSEIPTP